MSYDGPLTTQHDVDQYLARLAKKKAEWQCPCILCHERRQRAEVFLRWYEALAERHPIRWRLMRWLGLCRAR